MLPLCQRVCRSPSLSPVAECPHLGDMWPHGGTLWCAVGLICPFTCPHAATESVCPPMVPPPVLADHANSQEKHSALGSSAAFSRHRASKPTGWESQPRTCQQNGKVESLLLTSVPPSQGNADHQGLGTGPMYYTQMMGGGCGCREDRTGIRNDVDKSEKWPENNQIQFKRTAPRAGLGQEANLPSKQRASSWRAGGQDRAWLSNGQQHQRV